MGHGLRSNGGLCRAGGPCSSLVLQRLRVLLRLQWRRLPAGVHQDLPPCLGVPDGAPDLPHRVRPRLRLGRCAGRGVSTPVLGRWWARLRVRRPQQPHPRRRQGVARGRSPVEGHEQGRSRPGQLRREVFLGKERIVGLFAQGNVLVRGAQAGLPGLPGRCARRGVR